MNLIKYDAARFALQQAVEVDEVKDIRDKAQAMAAYAKQAKDTALVEWATEIKVRAERRAGQMLAEMPMNTGAATRSHDATALPKTLGEIGISKTQSSRWQKLAAVPEDQFEQAVAAAKEVAGEVTTAAMLRIEKANNAINPVPVADVAKSESINPEPVYNPADDELSEAHSTIQTLSAENDSLRDAIAAGALPDIEIKPAADTIAELREQVRTLEIVNSSITKARDQYMRENAELKKQVAAQAREIKKLKK